jgi:dsRNA-specific ribonuclease
MDPISILNEFYAKHRLPRPTYYVQEAEGPAHAPVFTRAEIMFITRDGFEASHIAVGQFKTKQQGKAAAAKAVLMKLLDSWMIDK